MMGIDELRRPYGGESKNDICPGWNWQGGKLQAISKGLRMGQLPNSSIPKQESYIIYYTV